MNFTGVSLGEPSQSVIWLIFCSVFDRRLPRITLKLPQRIVHSACRARLIVLPCTRFRSESIRITLSLPSSIVLPTIWLKSDAMNFKPARLPPAVAVLKVQLRTIEWLVFSARSHPVTLATVTPSTIT